MAIKIYSFPRHLKSFVPPVRMPILEQSAKIDKGEHHSEHDNESNISGMSLVLDRPHQTVEFIFVVFIASKYSGAISVFTLCHWSKGAANVGQIWPLE